MADFDHRSWSNVRVILRNPDGQLATELVALTGWSLRRAMDSVEGSLDPQARRRLTHQVIAPLESARACILGAAARPGSTERIVLSGDIAELCRCQYDALCLGLHDPSFPVDQLPPELADPLEACARFYTSAGLAFPAELVESNAPNGERPGDCEG